jgi:Protein of unknown function (DUF3298)/Deacetylase PdaC
MRLIIYYSVLLGGLTLFMACKNEPSSQKSTPSVSATSTDKKYNNYRHFRGTIGSYAITMDLVQTKTVHNFNEFPSFSGYYSYDKYQEPITFYGTMDSTGVVELEEGRGHKGTFRGKLNADSTFTGIWIDIEKKMNYPLMLRETINDGAIAMDIFPFEDSIKLFENKPNSPQATFSMDALLPAKNTEGSVFAFLRTEIFKHLKGDSITGNYDYLQISDVQKTARDSFFKDYKTELKDEKPDTTDMPYLNHESSTTMDVVSNADGLLTLGFKNYAFTGGAHGSYGTQLMTFDIKNKKLITLNDVFKPNYKSVLNAALTRKAKWYFGLKPNESLEGNTFESAIEANDNFAITGKGILFNYVPYEIASYAQGEIQLFIPFEELKSILK